ncbi:hypothetical protein [Williamsoniiplasma lucivorax]|nr:hypothetical protein [Williamsoniiplasma lucivorax]
MSLIMVITPIVILVFASKDLKNKSTSRQKTLGILATVWSGVILIYTISSFFIFIGALYGGWFVSLSVILCAIGGILLLVVKNEATTKQTTPLVSNDFQFMVDQAVQQLNDAMLTIKDAHKTNVDTKELKEKIKEAKLISADYKPKQAWHNFQDVIKSAEEVINNVTEIPATKKA